MHDTHEHLEIQKTLKRYIGGGADEVMISIIAKTLGVAKRPARS